MKVDLIDLSTKKVGDVTLNKAIFDLPERKDILHRMVCWQLAKRQSGTHKTKTISEVRGTTAKPFRQKGTGRARQGSVRATQFRGGATKFGPVVRSHAIKLTKKFRKLALKTALSTKLREGGVHVVKPSNDQLTKTAECNTLLKAFAGKTVLIIHGKDLPEGLAKVTSNLKHVNILPEFGANVYDIVRHDTVLLMDDALQQLEGRLS
jgi:large subunit ribosomal protein L4